MQHADKFGLSAGEVKFDLPKIVKRSRDVSAQLTKGVGFLMKKNKVTVIEGSGALAGRGKVSVTKDKKEVAQIEAKHIILATGARARQLPGLEADGKLVWTYKEALLRDMMPKSLLVVGSGAIGIEFASFFRTLGADVTVVELLDRILPVEDEEISKLAAKALEAQGMKIKTGATVKALKKNNDNVTATIEAGGKSEEATFERVIVAVGIVGNTEGLGLEGTKVKVERGQIVTDGMMRTRRAGRLRHRRRRRRAVAGAQGEP